MKLVLDTNIFISGLLLPESKAGKILKLWKQVKIELVTSNYLLQEIKRVLIYPKIFKRLQWEEKQVENFIELLSLFTIKVNTENIRANVPNDQKDNEVLATLIASDADYLVTGDKDLLSLQDKYNNRIITLSMLIEKLELQV